MERWVRSAQDESGAEAELGSVGLTPAGGFQGVRIKEASSAGRERTDVRDRPSSGADAELGALEAAATGAAWRRCECSECRGSS